MFKEDKIESNIDELRSIQFRIKAYNEAPYPKGSFQTFDELMNYVNANTRPVKGNVPDYYLKECWLDNRPNRHFSLYGITPLPELLTPVWRVTVAQNYKRIGIAWIEPHQELCHDPALFEFKLLDTPERRQADCLNFVIWNEFTVGDKREWYRYYDYITSLNLVAGKRHNRHFLFADNADARTYADSIYLPYQNEST